MPAGSNNIARRVLVGTLGYHNLTNHSIGPMLYPRLQSAEWPTGVDVEELNWGPIAVVQHLEALPYVYDRVVILTASYRQRRIGEITLHRWMGELPDNEHIQARIGDAVTGVISIDNLLVIGEYFKVWPDEVVIIDVEAGPEKNGPDLTPEVVSRIPAVLDILREAATRPLHLLPIMNEHTGISRGIHG